MYQTPIYAWVSGAEVRRAMEDLDAEIFQTAASLSETSFFRSQSTKAVASESVNSDLSKRVARFLGKRLVDLLLLGDGGSSGGSAMLVQIALQAAMCDWSFKTIGSWVFDRGDLNGINMFMDGLYADLRQSEDPAATARWRAMTRSQLSKRTASSAVRETLVGQIIDVLILASGRNDKTANWTVLETKFGERITALTKLALTTSRHIGVDVVSEDLESACISPNAKFDPRIMENTYLEDRSGWESETVVCTLGLGIWKKSSQGGPGEMLKKPQVILHTTLDQFVS
ncbi:hypothetical protein B0H10DRAFT_1968991 [Mycena sp. CBHHK59/15]|nr:hypothetical protein B0H10DRAFT_1968991 [Mycena sp. CBHHK59/15]